VLSVSEDGFAFFDNISYMFFQHDNIILYNKYYETENQKSFFLFLGRGISI
jgi:hypothetical protein